MKKKKEETGLYYTRTRYDIGDEVHLCDVRVRKQSRCDFVNKVLQLGRIKELSEYLGVSTSITKIWTYAFPGMYGAIYVYCYECEAYPGYRLPEAVLELDEDPFHCGRNIARIDKLKDAEDYPNYTLADKPVLYVLIRTTTSDEDITDVDVRKYPHLFIYRVGDDYCVPNLDAYRRFVEDESGGALALYEVTGVWCSMDEMRYELKKVDTDTFSPCGENGLALATAEGIQDSVGFKMLNAKKHLKVEARVDKHVSQPALKKCNSF